MFKKSVFVLIVFVCSISKAQNISKNALSYSDLLNQEFTGELAYETTAFIEKYWRVVGNTGFDKSVYFIADKLEKAGFINEDKATSNDRFTFRIEKRPLKNPTWEIVDASVKIADEDEPLLTHKTNSCMVALNSYSTPKEGINAELIYIENLSDIKNIDVKGKIVFAETSPNRLFRRAIVKGGAIGIMTYDNPSYLQPEKNTTSIQFRTIPLNKKLKPWALALSYQAKEHLKKRLKEGVVHLNVKVDTKIYESEELTIVAEIKGAKNPKERLVYSAHIQEPGANDNATGVGVAVEMACLTSKLMKEKQVDINRTLTFLWGDEIVSTRRYVQEDKERAKDIKWGISLDMVGENTAITGGTFLIEKMPDPSAVWTRGKDKHTEWGGRPLSLNQMKPHYLNDFLIDKFKEQGKRANWVVETNPYEGGSDHVPFLTSDIPSVLFWHFTDQFYHTDNDRLDKVSKETLKNVGTAALNSSFVLLNSEVTIANHIIETICSRAIARLDEELKQGQLAIKNGDELSTQVNIIKAWEDWYNKTIATTKDMVADKSSLEESISKAQRKISAAATSRITLLKE